MKIRPQHHLLLLVGFAALMWCLWMLPAWAMGYPYEVPNLVALQNGDFRASRLLPWLLTPFSSALGWKNPVPWLQLNAAALAVSLLPLWWVVYRVFTARIAWLTVIVFAFMPVHWLEALRLNGYSFAYIFIFLALIFFIEAKKNVRKKLWWLAGAGLWFGLALATRDAFILFLPGIVLAALYLGRKDAGKLLTGLAIFLAVAFLAYSSPILPQMIKADVGLAGKAQLFIGAQRGIPTWPHFYPDLYTYEFEKEAYLERIAGQAKSWPLLERIKAENYMLTFGASERTILSNLFIGTWLLVGSLPLLITQDYVGGVFLWLFIIPGGIYLYRKDKKLLWLLSWLVFSLMLTIRYVFLAQRSHIMDYGWVLALLAGLGVVMVTDQFKSRSFKFNLLLTGFIPLVIALQLLQANRVQIARFYHKSNTLDIYTVTDVLSELPAGSTVARPSARRDYFYLTDVDSVQFSLDTIKHLDSEHLSLALEYYGVTHAIGYSEAVNNKLPENIEVLKVPEMNKSLTAPSKLIEMMLNWFR